MRAVAFGIRSRGAPRLTSGDVRRRPATSDDVRRRAANDTLSVAAVCWEQSLLRHLQLTYICGVVDPMSVLDIDGQFDQMKFSRLRHQLAGHPLMTVESLAALALRLDPAHVRFHEGERSVGTHMGTLLTNDPTRDGLRRTLDNLHNAKAFVQIVNVRSDPAYRAVIDELLDEALPFLPPRDRQLINRDSAAFLASPRSVTRGMRPSRG